MVPKTLVHTEGRLFTPRFQRVKARVSKTGATIKLKASRTGLRFKEFLRRRFYGTRLKKEEPPPAKQEA